MKRKKKIEKEKEAQKNEKQEWKIMWTVESHDVQEFWWEAKKNPTTIESMKNEFSSVDSTVLHYTGVYVTHIV